MVDEWHDLLGNKRGVQIELAIAQLKALSPGMRVWGISATIGNLEEAMETLVGTDRIGRARIIRSDIEKRISVDSLMPEAFEKLAWAGHLGVQLLDQVVDIIRHIPARWSSPTPARSPKSGTKRSCRPIPTSPVPWLCTTAASARS